MNTPFFSIITPSHRPQLLQGCFQQVDRQTCQDYEHLVAVDLETMPEIPSSNSRRSVTCCGVAHRNWGNSCRNRLGKVASGQWVIYLDDDDEMSPLLLERLKPNLEKSTANWGYFGCLIEGKPFMKYPPHPGGITIQQIFHRKDINGEVITYRADGEYGNDWELVSRLYKDHQPLLIREVLSALPKYNQGNPVVTEWRK